MNIVPDYSLLVGLPLPGWELEVGSAFPAPKHLCFRDEGGRQWRWVGSLGRSGLVLPGNVLPRRGSGKSEPVCWQSPVFCVTQTALCNKDRRLPCLFPVRILGTLPCLSFRLRVPFTRLAALHGFPATSNEALWGVFVSLSLPSIPKDASG